MTDQVQKKPAYDFQLPNAEGKPVKLSDFRGKKVVLAFYPADFSPVCTSELALIQETLEDIHAYNAEVIGISCDNYYSHRVWKEQLHLDFPLLSDFWPHGLVSQQYDAFDENSGRSKRSLFFIDEDGILRDSWIAKESRIAPGMNIIFDALEKMKSTQGQEARNA